MSESRVLKWHSASNSNYEDDILGPRAFNMYDMYEIKIVFRTYR